jgi:hypothetical protein
MEQVAAAVEAERVMQQRQLVTVAQEETVESALLWSFHSEEMPMPEIIRVHCTNAKCPKFGKVHQYDDSYRQHSVWKCGECGELLTEGNDVGAKST